MQPPDQSAIDRRERSRYRTLVLVCVLASVLLGLGLAWLVDRAGAGRDGSAALTMVVSVNGPLTDLLPGDERRGQVQVSSTGAARLAFTLATLSGARDPDLTDTMEIEVRAARDPACTDFTGPVHFGGRLTDLRLPPDALAAAPESTTRLCFALRLPLPVGNAYQGATDDLSLFIIPSTSPR